MANDDDWVSNVKRWCLENPVGADARAPAIPVQVDDPAFDTLGYETAHPALQARHWPDAAAR